SINLPRETLRKIYFDNARRLLAPAIPLPVIKATHLENDFVPDGRLNEPEWQQAMPIRIEDQTKDVIAMPELSTAVRALWSSQFLYLSYECPFTKLSFFSPTQ